MNLVSEKETQLASLGRIPRPPTFGPGSVSSAPRSLWWRPSGSMSRQRQMGLSQNRRPSNLAVSFCSPLKPSKTEVPQIGCTQMSCGKKCGPFFLAMQEGTPRLMEYEAKRVGVRIKRLARTIKPAYICYGGTVVLRSELGLAPTCRPSPSPASLRV